MEFLEKESFLWSVFSGGGAVQALCFGSVPADSPIRHPGGNVKGSMGVVKGLEEAQPPRGI